MTLKASNKLKSFFNANSFLASSISLSIYTYSFKAYTNFISSPFFIPGDLPLLLKILSSFLYSALKLANPLLVLVNI